MDAALPWCRHREPAELPELAENHRSARSRLRTAGMDHGRRRIGTLSTGFTIRANNKLAITTVTDRSHDKLCFAAGPQPVQSIATARLQAPLQYHLAAPPAHHKGIIA